MQVSLARSSSAEFRFWFPHSHVGILCNPFSLLFSPHPLSPLHSLPSPLPLLPSPFSPVFLYLPHRLLAKGPTLGHGLQDPPGCGCLSLVLCPDFLLSLLLFLYVLFTLPEMPLLPTSMIHCPPGPVYSSFKRQGRLHLLC